MKNVVIIACLLFGAFWSQYSAARIKRLRVALGSPPCSSLLRLAISRNPRR